MTPRWIVGIDGSDGALAALRWAVVHASRAGAEVEAINAFHVPVSLSLLAVKRGFDVDRLGLEAEAHHLLEEAIDAVDGAAGLVHPIAIEGQPSSTLLDVAADSALLIVGRRGGGGLRHLVLGSVTSYCATHAEVPVLVVPSNWESGPYESVAVGFDGSHNSLIALRWALDTVPEEVKLRLVVAIEAAPWLSEDITMARFPDQVRNEEQRILAEAAQVDAEHRAERDVVFRGPRQALAAAADETDLVIVGGRGHGRVGAALLGSVSTWLLHSAPCPVAVVPPTAEDD